ncbi:F-box protein CPR1-like [Impatiens glandulifera]|uniref:F-box protein CPR1-like n=1 Tax=Impatiens glandulifera TaxID=253017 RepID=UPI001FB0FB46|nr:F-box protein CPR1-like [Impatiens glandulifera]
MVHLSDEILEKVLCRLPVKLLLRFRCVSKSWLALISSPYFVKLHLKLSVQTKRNINLNLYRHNDISLKFLNYELRSSFSCDGLLCMSNVNNALDNVFLWNPSIRKSIKLPYESTDHSIHLGFPSTCVYQIGYDNINDDYKVVRTVVFLKTGDIIDYEVKVYSLRSNSWHKLEKFSHCPDWNSFGNSIIGGALHWISTGNSYLNRESLIVSFDLATEKSRVLPQPEYRNPYYKLYVDKLGGCLLLSCHYESSTIVDIFLLKEYGGKNEHWSKWITLSPPTPSFRIDYPLQPITYSNNGKKVLFAMGYNRHVWYNLEEKSFEKMSVYCVDKLFTLYTCLESLVSLPIFDLPTAITEIGGVA